MSIDIALQRRESDRAGVHDAAPHISHRGNIAYALARESAS